MDCILAQSPFLFQIQLVRQDRMSLEEDFTAAVANMDNIRTKLSEDELIQVLCTRAVLCGSYCSIL